MTEKKRGNPRKINQKAISLKVDIDLLGFLQENKPVNRFINDLIRNKKESLAKYANWA